MLSSNLAFNLKMSIMKKLLYTILLSLGTFLFTACTDYINVDKYFYDQVSLDSAFSKRVYVEGWLSSAYSVMDNIGEYREPFAGQAMIFIIRI